MWLSSFKPPVLTVDEHIGQVIMRGVSVLCSLGDTLVSGLCMMPLLSEVDFVCILSKVMILNC